MKLVWLLLAILLTSLTIGGLHAAATDVDTISTIGDLVISILLGWAAVAAWRRTRT